MSGGFRRARRVAFAAAAVLAVGAPAAGAAADPVSIATLSDRADLISGGDALVGIDLAKGVGASGLRVTVGGRDVTTAFARHDGRLEGLVDGLRVGTNVLTARLPDGRGARLTIVNHPIGGPLFSGPQIQPWYCLDGALDAQCNRPTTFTWSYKSTDST